jgi:inhibitor of cysteine peptidase
MKGISKHRWACGLAIALLAILIVGCRSSNTVAVDDRNNGSQVTLKKGQILVVTLDASPGTGYGWAQIAAPEDILRQQGETELRQKIGTGRRVGAPESEILRFEATAPGRTTLELAYRRPWETDVAPAKTYTLSVTVR